MSEVIDQSAAPGEAKPAKSRWKGRPTRMKLMVALCVAIYGEYAKDVILGRERGGTWYMYPQDLLQFDIDPEPAYHQMGLGLTAGV